MRRLIIASLLGLTALSTNAFAAPPDLIGDFDTAIGKITVKNQGIGPAGPSVVTVECKRRKPPVVGGGGGCPDIPSTVLSNYTNPAYPNGIAMNVGPLAPGASFTHVLPFFAGLVFPSGAYAFTVKVDAGGTVPESNEGNNIRVRTKIVP